MFIVTGKSHCCNDTFTEVAASKEHLRGIQIIFILLESAFR